MKKILNKVLVIFCLFALLFFSINYSQTTATYGENLSAIYQGNTDSNKVSFMINVYWGSEYIPSMLEALDDYNVKTTFFVGGMWVEKEPELFKQIYDNGHEIANHGYYHRDQDKLNYSDNYSEINDCHEIVKSQIGVSMNLFAPPSGAYNNATLMSANDLGYKTIMWTRDTIDWRDHDTDIIYNRAIKNIKGGDLILMHPTQNTMEALPKILEYCKTHNIIATTVSDVLS